MTNEHKLMKVRTIIQMILSFKCLKLEELESKRLIEVAACPSTDEIVVTMNQELCEDLDSSYSIQGSIAHALDINFEKVVDCEFGDWFQLRIQ